MSEQGKDAERLAPQSREAVREGEVLPVVKAWVAYTMTGDDPLHMHPDSFFAGWDAALASDRKCLRNILELAEKWDSEPDPFTAPGGDMRTLALQTIARQCRAAL